MTVPYQNNAMNLVRGHIVTARKFSCDSCWEPLLQATFWIKLPQASNCKATSASPSLFSPQYSNHHYLLFQSAYFFSLVFPTLSLSPSQSSILSVSPIASSSLAAVCQWLHACGLSAQTTACVVSTSVSVLLTEYTTMCFCVYLFQCLPSAEAWR